MTRTPVRSNPQVCIPVLGMHRSGTSAVTRVINLLGVDLGKNLMGATPANPRGHWERLDLYDFHEAVLAEIGSAWNDPGPIDPCRFDMPAAAKWPDRLSKIIASEFAESHLFAVKDPRSCRLLPIWYAAAEQLNLELRPILMLRHPFEVAASLNHRQPIETDVALRLWLSHVLEAERSTRTHKRAFVRYEDLLRDWRGTLIAAGQALDIKWPKIDDPVVNNVLNLFVNRGDRHHLHSKNQHDSQLAALAAEIYTTLSRANGTQDDEDHEILQTVDHLALKFNTNSYRETI
ncbi:sulfotransferase family protein [Bosea beijingensis]|uniref:sulfotransferase family protein n=1 Tax=Bosea beijingensis TaxID=3068632 RepID=UPI002740B0E3|nr:hypothetical protein [Bosea sp. REN20]